MPVEWIFKKKMMVLTVCKHNLAWVFIGVPPGRTCPKHLSEEMFSKHPSQMPESPQLTPYDAD